MSAFGIICEYNPFHTGHQWQISELRRRFGAECAVVCATSGNFVQRGDFAIVRKHARAEAAVRGGADLVLEVPMPWATASAEGFARGGVGVLAGTGVVDTLCFGSECADTEKLKRVAVCLTGEEFSNTLHAELDKGNSFAAARERAAEKLCGADAAVLRDANDILGVEYCKALSGTAITPLALPRRGVDHDSGAAGEFASASYLREKLLTGEPCGEYLTADMARLYEAECKAGRAPVSMANAERAMLARLRTMTEDDFARYDEGNEGLYHRLYDASRAAASIEELLAAAKTKRYAYARLRRTVLRMYLGIETVPEKVLYLRVLACNERGRALLKQMKTSASVPILTKSADVRELSADAQRLFAIEARATDLYTLAYPDLAQSVGGSEWTTNPVIL